MKLTFTRVCPLVVGLAALSSACGAPSAQTPAEPAPGSSPPPATEPAVGASATPQAAASAPALTCEAQACADEADKLSTALSTKLAEAGDKEIDTTEEDARIAALYRRACDGKVPRACYEVFELDRRNAKVPPEKLAELLILACDGKVGGACAFLADAYRDGKGVPKDHDKHVQSLVSACTLTIFTQCKLVHDLAKSPSEKIAVAAVAKWKKDCAAGDKDACTSAKTTK